MHQVYGEEFTNWYFDNRKIVMKESCSIINLFLSCMSSHWLVWLETDLEFPECLGSENTHCHLMIIHNIASYQMLLIHCQNYMVQEGIITNPWT